MSWEDQFSSKEINVLFLDVSSSCTGYSIAKCTFETRRAEIVKSGCLWLNPKWSHQEKYSYMFHAIMTYFWIVEKIDYIVHESYAVNPNRMAGVLVVPEMLGSIKVAAQENGVKVDSLTPQTWRKELGIKPTKDDKGKRDYKKPTKDKINSMVTIPDTCISNITGEERTTPSDLYDAIGLGLGWLTGLKGKDNVKFFNVVKVDKNMKINTHLGTNIGE